MDIVIDRVYRYSAFEASGGDPDSYAAVYPHPLTGDEHCAVLPFVAVADRMYLYHLDPMTAITLMIAQVHGDIPTVNALAADTLATQRTIVHETVTGAWVDTGRSELLDMVVTALGQPMADPSRIAALLDTVNLVGTPALEELQTDLDSDAQLLEIEVAWHMSVTISNVLSFLETMGSHA